MKKLAIFVSASMLIALTHSLAFGTVVHFQTIPGGNVAGKPVDARATFTTSLNTISLKVDNLLADPNDVKQVIYDLLFSVSTGQNSGTISSITALERTISSGGTFTDGPILTRTGGLIDWDLNTDGSQLHLDRLTFPGQKKHGIVGPPNAGSNEYDDASGSITGGPHNPFFGQTATFLLDVPGVTADSTITAVTFSFNTTPGNNVPGEQFVPTPEPGSAVLAAFGLCGLMGLAVRRRWRRRSSR
jgi:hypothetical protein